MKRTTIIKHSKNVGKCPKNESSKQSGDKKQSKYNFNGNIIKAEKSRNIFVGRNWEVFAESKGDQISTLLEGALGEYADKEIAKYPCN